MRKSYTIKSFCLMHLLTIEIYFKSLSRVERVEQKLNCTLVFTDTFVANWIVNKKNNVEMHEFFSQKVFQFFDLFCLWEFKVWNFFSFTDLTRKHKKLLLFSLQRWKISKTLGADIDDKTVKLSMLNPQFMSTFDFIFQFHSFIFHILSSRVGHWSHSGIFLTLSRWWLIERTYKDSIIDKKIFDDGLKSKVN